MSNSFFTLCLVLAIVGHSVVSASAPAEKSQGKVRNTRQIGPGGLLLGAAGLTALAGTAGFLIGMHKGNKHHHHNAYPVYVPYPAYGYGGYGRKRRNAELNVDIDEAMVLRVAALDESGCGARLLCELHQEEPSQLNGTISRRLVQIFELVYTI